MTPPSGPPPGADRLLEWMLPRGTRGLSIIGDLHLEFRDVVARRGRPWARVWYWREAVALSARYAWAGPGRDTPGDERGEPMTTLMADLRFGARMLRRTPGLSLIAVATIALGVGLTTQTYSSLDGTVLRGLPVPDADRLMFVEERIDRLGIDQNGTPLHDFLDLQERQTVFEELAAYHWSSFNLAGEEAPPERVQGAAVSANALTVVGVPPLLGRVFRPGEDAPDAPPRIVLSYALWKNRFAGDAGVVGRTIRVNGEATEVVGVMPDGFEFPFQHVAWMPYHFDPATTPRRSAHLEVFGRRLAGVSEEAVTASLGQISRDIEAIYPVENEGVRLWAGPYAERYMPPQITAVMFLMLAATFGVLLIACANVANLLLARASARGREVAIRTALGASRFRVMRQLLAEAFVIAVMGGLLGVGLAYVGIEGFNAVIVDIQKPYWIDNRLDLPALLFALGVTLVATLAAGTVPALRASGLGVGDALRDEARGSSSRRLGRLTSALVVTEIAVSCGLLIGAGLMIRSIVNLKNTDLGFRPEHVLTGRVQLQQADYPTAEERRAFFQALEDRMKAEPGATSVALASSLPALGAGTWWVMADGRVYATDGDVPQVNGSVVTRGFFETMGIPVLRGRDFDPAEVWDAVEPVGIVNESFVRRVLGDADPLGARVRLGRIGSTDPWLRIVGVVPDVHVGGGVGGLGDDKRRPEALYVPPSVLDVSSLWAAVRTDGAPTALAPRLRALVTELDPNLPVSDLQAMPAAIQSATWAFGLFGSLFTIFGVAALFMASVGLYGVMSFSVAQRRQEIGVRMALGASRRRILRMVLNEGTAQLGIGMVLGLLLGYVLAKPLSFVTYGVSLGDPFLYLFILGTLGAVGLVACFVPARSATRADPVSAMRP
ncbi:MAG TPA: ADOP family duplicated permease, partial [Longimicrobiales bacterium]|nr:ADOP family duplicated permease [Longimicrobiales bacterium]